MPPSYRPEIDGLRALAVLPVIAFHAGFPGFSGGFVGVDVFFVISGYLITQILAGDLREGRFSIARFYERRARRILPALVVVVAVSVVLAHLLLLPPAFKDFSASVFATGLFLSNILFIAEVDYFGPAAHEVPLLHTWSLAVEEQFYILFPLILWVLWRLGRERALVWGVLALSLASLIFAEWILTTRPAETFFFLPSRAWELGAGALCALLPRPGRSPFGDGLALAGLVAIVAAVTLMDRSFPFPSLWALVPVGGAVAVILWAHPGNLAGRLLSLRAVVGIGLISYSAYLWHNPVFVFARFQWGEPGTPALLALTLLSLALAWASWRWVEQPFRHAPGRAPMLATRGRVFAASGAAMAAMVVFGLWGWFSEGRAALWLAQASPAERQTYALLEPSQVLVRHLDAGPCRFNQRTVTDDTLPRLRDCHAQHGPGLAIVGDSHAINLADALILADAAPFVFGITQGACRPDSPRDECGHDGFAALVAANPDLFARIVFEVSGQHLIEGPGGRRSERLFAYYAPEDPMPADEITLLSERIAANLAWAEALAAHAPVIWLTPRVEPHIPFAHILARGCDHGFDLRPGQRAIFDRLAAEITARAAVTSRVQVLDQGPLLDLRLPDDLVTCDALHWRDGDHLSPSGLAWLGPRLAPALLP